MAGPAGNILEENTYDPSRNPPMQINADGNTIKYAYDAGGRLKYSETAAGVRKEYKYNTYGNITAQSTGKEAAYHKTGIWGHMLEIETASGGGIKYTYEYDICGRLKSKSACGRTLIKYGYDLNGNRTSVTDVTGKTTLYKYDITGRLAAISENDKILAEYTYTPCGKVSEIKCGDIRTEYGYDTDGRKSVLKVTVGKNVISDIKYDYDESGNCIKKANSADGINAVTEYGYDGMGRLIRVNSPDTVETYAYDNAGNRISRTINGEIKEKYRYNELNELLSIESPTKDNSHNKARNFTYDADGNMTSDGKGIYKYDSLNRMSEAVMEDGRKLICRYDAEGLRHETEENGRLIRFIYSGREAACEEADDNITRYIRGNGRLVASDSENARTYYHYACDSLGSITHVVAGNEFGNGRTNGNINSRILCSYEYDAFGNTISGEETVTNRYGFTGEMHDCITGMYYLRARYYCTDTGRFTQEDTYHEDGLNLYVYAGNNPVRYVDPSGHVCKSNDPDGICENGSNTNGLFDGAPEPEVQNFIERFKKRYPGREYMSGHMLQHSDGRNIEIDFETDNAILEFKRGNGKGLTRQIIDRQDPKVNPLGKVVIGVPGSKMSRFAKRDVENAGGLMSNDIDLILELISLD